MYWMILITVRSLIKLMVVCSLFILLYVVSRMQIAVEILTDKLLISFRNKFHTFCIIQDQGSRHFLHFHFLTEFFQCMEISQRGSRQIYLFINFTSCKSALRWFGMIFGNNDNEVSSISARIKWMSINEAFPKHFEW